MRTAKAALAALCVVGCVQGSAVDSPTPASSSATEHSGSAVAAVALSPAAISGKPGQSVALTASVTTTTGGRDSSARISWVSSNPAIATVSDSGMVKLVAAGSAQISATAGGVTAVAAATCSQSPAPVATVRVSPSTASLTPGQYTPLTAVPLDSAGNQLTGQTVTWSSSNTSIATVSSSGIVTAVAVGAAVITATSGGISGTAHVTVAAASPAPVASVTVSPASTSLTVGGTAQLTATDKDAGGNVLAGRSVTWSSSNNATATVNSSGVVTAVAAGSATITASSGGQTGTASVTVGQAPVASVTVTPATSSITTGQTLQLTATAYDAGGHVLTGRSVSWSSSAAAVATVSGSGLVTAAAVGTVKITATIGGQSGSSSITVGPPAVSAVSVSPTQASIGVGGTQQLTAKATSATGTTVTGVTYTWSSSNSSMASVSSSGLVTGVAAGSATITVSAAGKTATANVTVTGTTTSTGSLGYGNQPSGATTISERAFNALAEDGWPSPLLYNGGQGAITTDASAPKSPSNVLQVTFPAGFPAGDQPYDQAILLDGSAQYTQLYGSIWLKYSPGFAVDGAGILKILYMWASDDKPSLCLCVNNYTAGGGNFTPQLGLQDATNQNLIPNVSGQVGYGFPTGQWVRLEFLLVMNSPGQSNGVAKVWANGVLVTNFTNVDFVSSSTQEYWHKLEIAPYWGGLGGTVPSAQYLWVDHLYASGAN
jgi:uncharacterized protein YjdB